MSGSVVTAVGNMQFVLPKNLPRFYLPAERGLVQISSAVSTVLYAQKCAAADAAEAEHCGYGDLH